MDSLTPTGKDLQDVLLSGKKQAAQEGRRVGGCDL